MPDGTQAQTRYTLGAFEAANGLVACTASEAVGPGAYAGFTVAFGAAPAVPGTFEVVAAVAGPGAAPRPGAAWAGVTASTDGKLAVTPVVSGTVTTRRDSHGLVQLDLSGATFEGGGPVEASLTCSGVP
jgi:hypothetical protein